MSGGESTRVERIRTVVQDAFHPVRLEIRDDSAAHAGHAGGGGKGHFKLLIVSDRFSGRSPLQRHRLVHEALASLLESDIHALVLNTKAPEELI
ncbi:MAG: BolA family transcriptional regulator [Gammaproteobacteria bacterium]|nr:BolA family transcriptional regulator [Gammaproteobacteria bacterium]